MAHGIRDPENEICDYELDYDERNKPYTKAWHKGLNTFKVFRGRDEDEVEQKAEAQLAQWKEAWGKKCALDQARGDREQKKALAEKQTADAQKKIEELQNLLSFTLNKDDRVDWDTLKDKTPFNKPQPNIPMPAKPTPVPSPLPPRRDDPRYKVTLGFLDNFSTTRKQQKIDSASRLFAQDMAAWEHAKKQAELRTQESLKVYNEQVAKWSLEAKAAYQKWEGELAEFNRRQAEHNASIDRLRSEYEAHQPDKIIAYCKMVLSRSEYPKTLNMGQYDLEYDPDSKILIVEYSLPSLDDMPKTKAVKYVQTRDALEETQLTSSIVNDLYDTVLYQICLRTIHELYEADTIQAIDMIVFNGWVNSIDSSTGQEVNACILSLQAKRDEFLSINLAQIEPKACFKKLKGVAGAKLHGMSAIAPILQMNRNDKRFVSSYAVADQLNDEVNIAAMDWEDFEHLIRELFEKEFSQGGGEVKVTQASRDGGVDAVAFDPDPIRGGKIVIQAKRYTNTVGVSAVRDLYGTVLNEGATKGILVTTASYGPDAYEFAKGKPITLLNGSNLLFLLEKHGHKAKIDLNEAKMQKGQ
ncbi:MAG: restriction endonuclease [Armatimonadota bacterium]